MESTPKTSIRPGQIVYLVESCRYVREAVVCRCSGGLFTLRFTDTGGGVRLRADRLYPTRAAAQACVRRLKEERQQTAPASGCWHNVPLWQC